jgi:hypothetical protein
MRATFTEVATRAELVAERESELRQRKNVAVLLAWGNGPEHGLGENIQTLAELVQEASVMGEGTGRVRRCVEEFETWIGKVQEIWAVRDTRLAVVEGLGEVWRAESKGLVRRVKGLMRILEGLERPNEADCTLAEVMTGVEELFRGMLEELVAVVSIERTIMDKEKHWIDEQLQQLGLGGGENETAMRITN